MTQTLLQVQDLRVEILEGRHSFFPVDGVSFSLRRGESLGVVGESGSGKSLTLRAILDLLPAVGRIADGEILFAMGGDAAPLAPADLRGRGIAMVFQEPATALNPLVPVGQLIGDAYRGARGASRAEVQINAIRLMDEVGIPAARERLRAYPHELSGGLRQRVMIAMALAAEPQVLLCDEPTTALDVTVQQQILELLSSIRKERGLALVFVTHDLAVVSQVCDRVAVMYAGRVVETGTVEEVFSRPAHPYTGALLRSVPRMDVASASLSAIPGAPPDPRDFPDGCRFHPRCSLSRADCHQGCRELIPIDAGRTTACIHHEELVSVESKAGG